MTLQELTNLVLPSLASMKPACSLVKALNLTHNAIMDFLIQAKSDVLIEETLIDIAEGSGYESLPDDFISLFCRPQIVGGGFLSSLPTSDTSNLETPGTPGYYSITGRTIRIYPPTDKSIRIKMLARVRKAEPLQYYEDLPFNGLFDQVYIDGVISVLSGGAKALVAKQYMQVIQMQMKQILSGIEYDNEQLLANSINGL